jgi:PAS domain S-box-containing protein
MPQHDQRTADALRASEARLRTILDTAVDAFITINAAGIVESFNPAAERMFGYAADEVIGRNVSMLMPPPYADEHDDYLRRYLKTGERKIIGIGREAVGLRKDGSVFPLDLAVGEATIAGQSVFTGVIRDLTERKKLESNLLRAQRMELVGSLAGGIAHDLNNVLAVILTAAGNLQLDLPDADRRQVLDELMTAARRGMTVVRQIVSFARGVTPTSGPLDARPLLHDFERLLRHLLPRSISIQSNIPQDLPLFAGDEAQLYQVLLNLCVNARDAMPQGGTLALEVQPAELPATESANGPIPKYVVISVADTGVGIPTDKMETIFEPFFTTKPPGQGTGLGLATVRDLVRGLNGFVSVASTVGHGTQFKIHWPVGRPERSRALAAPEGHGELILVADSDRSAAELARAALETYGYRTAMAYDAGEAMAHLAAHGADVRVVVIDAATSLTAREILAAAPQTCIVGLGALSDCRVCIQKPYSADDLLRAVSRALSLSAHST